MNNQNYIHHEPDPWVRLHSGASGNQRIANAKRLAKRYLSQGSSERETTFLLYSFGTQCSPPLQPEEIFQIVNEVHRENTGQIRQTDSPILLGLDTVEPEEVFWLWKDRIPLRKLTLLVGDPALGKSLFTADVSSRISTGSSWPDGTPATKGSVILLSAEDGPADTIRPRLDSHGADCNKIFCLTAIRKNDSVAPFCLKEDIVHLESAIEQTSASLVVIDPLTAYLGGTNTIKDVDVRSVLSPLSELAARKCVAVLAVMHLNKDSKNHAIYRTAGSMAFVAQARSVLALSKDFEDNSRRVLFSIKNNLSRIPPAYAFTVSEEGRIEWDPNPVDDFDIENAFTNPSPQESSKVEQAEGLLVEFLKDGPMPANCVFAEGMVRGLSASSIRRAQKRMGIKPFRRGGIADEGEWLWSLS